MATQGKLLHRSQSQGSVVPKRVTIRRLSGAAVSYAFPFQAQPHTINLCEAPATETSEETNQSHADDPVTAEAA